MDPVKKTFTKAFEDFELPVREDLWENVLLKKQQQKRRTFPLYRLAAAIALCITAGGIFWLIKSGNEKQEQPLVQVDRSPSLPLNDNLKEQPSEQPIIPIEKEIVLQTKLSPSNKESAKSHTTVVPAAIIHEKIQIVADLPAPSSSIMEKLPEMEEAITITEVLKVDELSIPSQDVPEQHIVASENREPNSSPRSLKHTLSKVLAKFRPPSLDNNKTGPERIIATLENLKPKMVDDLLAIANRRTEIEINW